MKLLNSLVSVISVEEHEGQSVYRLRLNAGHPILLNHFSGLPIVPGACLMQLVSELTASRLQRSVRLTEVTNVKFVGIISPQANDRIDARLSELRIEGRTCRVRMSFEVAGKTCSTHVQTYRIENG